MRMEEKRREERERERTVNTAHSVSPTSERGSEGGSFININIPFHKTV